MWLFTFDEGKLIVTTFYEINYFVKSKSETLLTILYILLKIFIFNLLKLFKATFLYLQKNIFNHSKIFRDLLNNLPTIKYNQNDLERQLITYNKTLLIQSCSLLSNFS